MTVTGGRRVALVAIVLTASLAAGAAPVGAGTGAAAGDVQSPAPLALQDSIDADAVTMTVALADDGSARWTVDYRIELDGENETEAFRTLQSDVETNREAYVADFADRIRATVADAENATGREMRATNFSVQARTEGVSTQYGVVTYEFEWRGFAATPGAEIRAGDALAGLFLDSRTSLKFSWPEGYELQRVSPPADSTGTRTVSWDGRLSFGAGEPALVLESATTAGGPPVLPLAVGGVVLVALVGGAVYYLRGRASGGVAGGGGSPTASGAEVAAGAGTETAANGAGDDAAAGGSGGADAGTSDGPVAEAGAGAGAGAGAASAVESDDTEDEEPPEPPSELLSNEERVLHLLRDRGGRIKQQTVVEELDWTAAKTSQVVNDMREAETIEVFRLGRENVLRLPEEDEEEMP